MSRNSRLLIAGFFLDVFARGVFNFALPWLSLKAGLSVPLTIVLTSLGLGISLILSLKAGHIADHTSRRGILRKVEGANTLATLGVFLVCLFLGIQIWALVLCTVLIGLAKSFTTSTTTGALTLTEDREKWAQNYSSISVINQVGFFGGPALGGLLLALFGNNGLLLSIAILYSLSAICAYKLDDPLGEEKEHEFNLREGIKTLWRDPPMRRLLQTGFYWNIAALFMPLVISLLSEKLFFSPLQAGAVLAAGATGSAASIFLVSHSKVDLLKSINLALLSEGIFIMIMGTVESLFLVASFFCLLMFCNTTIAASLLTARALQADSDKQSLTTATGHMVHMTGFFLVCMISALLMTRFTFQEVYLLSGIGMILVALFFYKTRKIT